MVRFVGLMVSTVVGTAALCAAVLPAAAQGAADRFVYVSNGFPTASNTVSALRINADGSLTQVPGSPFATAGTVTEGLAVSPDAKNVYVAHFGTDNVSAFSITGTGGLAAVPGSPFGTGFDSPLGVTIDPDGGHLFGWNHGAQIAVSQRTAGGGLANIAGSPFSTPSPATNPFAGSVAPDGDHLYVPNENNSPSGAPETVTAYAVAANGALNDIQTLASGNPANQTNPFGSAITPDGSYLYVSNPEDGGVVGTISGFRVNANGTLTTIDVSPGVIGNWRSASPGSHPLNMAITPTGSHLYVTTRLTDTVNAYAINADGSLTPVPGQPFATGSDNGKALAITPDGKRLYVSNPGSNPPAADNISGFNIQSDGSLTLIPGSPWPTGSADPDLESIAITPNQGPTAKFRMLRGRLRFDGSPSFDPDGNIVEWRWDFGNGVTRVDDDPIIRFRFRRPGFKTVSLTVFDDEACGPQRIFTGKATLCNADPLATRTRTVFVPGCAGRGATVLGRNRRDVLFGTRRRDVIAGLRGGDRVVARGGRDIVCGNRGPDVLFGGRGVDRILGGFGADKLRGGRGSDKLRGGPGVDDIRQ